jgi:hypothetical protein
MAPRAAAALLALVGDAGEAPPPALPAPEPEPEPDLDVKARGGKANPFYQR